MGILSYVIVGLQNNFFRFRRMYAYMQWGIGIFNFSVLLSLVYEDPLNPISGVLSYFQFLGIFWLITIPALTVIGRREWRTVRENEQRELWRSHPLHDEMVAWKNEIIAAIEKRQGEDHSSESSA